MLAACEGQTRGHSNRSAATHHCKALEHVGRGHFGRITQIIPERAEGTTHQLAENRGKASKQATKQRDTERAWRGWQHPHTTWDVPVVVGQDDAAEEEGHDAREVHGLADGVRGVCAQEQHDDLLVRVLAQLRVLEELHAECAAQMNETARPVKASNDSPRHTTVRVRVHKRRISERSGAAR